jgi:hypothetical protein
MIDEIRTKHPSFGLIGISRCTGNTALVGSEIKHTHYFHLCIKEAEKSESFGKIDFFGRKSLIDIYLSPNQFLDIMTQLNVGDGTPCTLSYVDGIRREPPSVEQPRIEKAAEYGKKEVLESIQKNNGLLQEIMTILEKVPNKTKAQVEQILQTIIDNQNSNANFYIQRIVDATEKSIQVAKTEIDSYVGGVVRQLGIDSLQTLSKAVKEIEEEK